MHTNINSWNHTASTENGLHTVISPDISDCSYAEMAVLNLEKGQVYTLETGEKEMALFLVFGSCNITVEGKEYTFAKLDSLYAPGRQAVEFHANEKSSFYIAFAVDEGYGKTFVRRFDADQPVGDIHTQAGKGSAQRDVYFTVGPDDASSRLLCGFTFGHDGGWTSWAPHQHEKDLEEVYAYFDIEKPFFGLHISYLKAGEPDTLKAHVVHSGSMVLASSGYHPTVAAPGTRMSYFWALFAYSHDQRRYDIAISDPNYSK